MSAKNNIKLGFFVTLSILAFTMAVYYIGSQKNMFKPKFTISTHFNNVKGLRVGNSVRYAGINVGSVRDIIILNDSTLRVEMVLDDNVKNVIKKDATATIGTDGLVGNMIVNINPGDGEFSAVEDGDVITSFSRIDPNDILMTLGNTNENIAILSVNLLEITEKLNKGHGTLPLLISDSLMAVDLRRSIDNLYQTSQHVKMMSWELQRTLRAVNEGDGMLSYLLYDTTFMHRLETFTLRMDTLFIRETEPVIASLRQSGENIAATSAQLKSIVEEVEKGEGLATAILKDTAAARDLQETLENLNEGTARFNENMEALQHNFLFRAFFRKQEKEKERKKADAPEKTKN